MTPWGLAVSDDGTIVMGDNQNLFSCHPASGPVTCPGALFGVDPVSGAQTLLTEKELFHDVAGVDVYRGPNVATPTLRRSWGQLKSSYR